MKTHRFDPYSLLLGIITVVVGIAAVNSRIGNLINDRPDALIPVLVLSVGFVAIGVAMRRSVQNVDGPSDDQNDSAE